MCAFVIHTITVNCNNETWYFDILIFFLTVAIAKLKFSFRCNREIKCSLIWLITYYETIQISISIQIRFRIEYRNFDHVRFWIFWIFVEYSTSKTIFCRPLQSNLHLTRRAEVAGHLAQNFVCFALNDFKLTCMYVYY